ncbi:MAG: replication-associated recombination protein A [Ruminococcaceae bacterium]|nr:replication-associated recombination protein A [Oscillospiraceae bacterium]
MYSPLAARLRPTSLDDFVGQKHLVGPGKPLRKIIESGIIPNMIFYGYSGIGKTTLAKIIADRTNKTLYVLNATTASTGDIKQIISDLDSLAGQNGVILYLDEIQYFNKKQQQILLEFIENGSITLIASTTENPYFYVYNAILSRSTVFEFKPVDRYEVIKAVNRAFEIVKSENAEVEYTIEKGVSEHISQTCGGDVRKAMNSVELLTALKVGQTSVNITLEDAKAISQKSNMRYDRDGDAHYDILSAFQKSIRGSDENAALHYLARLLEGGDLASICRRLLVIASEDIGLAYPQAASIVKSCVDSSLQLGLPEARIPLAQAVILLATAPKSNSVVCAIDAAIEKVRTGEYGDIPDHLKDSHYAGAEKMGRGTEYKYPHSYENNYIKQQYLPDKIKYDIYYSYGNNKNEQAAKAYWDKIKKK